MFPGKKQKVFLYSQHPSLIANVEAAGQKTTGRWQQRDGERRTKALSEHVSDHVAFRSAVNICLLSMLNERSLNSQRTASNSRDNKKQTAG